MIPSRDVLEATRRRYEETKQEQEETKALIADNRRHEADTPEQRLKRRQRLLRAPLVRETIERATMAPVKAAMTTESSAEAAAVLPPDIYERVIGASNFLGVAFLTLGLRAARTVTCIRVWDGSSGTGFMVSPELLLTNHHVLPNASFARGSKAVFNFERDENRKPLPAYTYDLDPDRFFLNDKALDYALVAVKPQSHPVDGQGTLPLAGFGYNRLSAEQGKIQEAEKVNLIQHPSGAVKQLALQDNDVTKRLPDHIQYVTDTMPGSSGAPVFNNQWEVIALHHSGVPDTFEEGAHKGKYRTVDGQVWEEWMGDDKIKWLSNEGIRISRIMGNVQARLSELSAEQQELAQAMLKAVPPGEPAGPTPESVKRPTPPSTDSSTGSPGTSPDRSVGLQAARPAASTDAVTGGEAAALATTASDGGVTLSIPLEITVRLGGLMAAPVMVSGESFGTGGEGLLERVVIDRDYSNRRGYDENFLGVSAPMPLLTTAQERDAAINRMPVPGMKPYVLPYYHYSVVMNGRRKIAYFTAGCVSDEPGKRPDLGKREGDAWIRDDRIAREEQTGESHYRNKMIDRGHLTRRLDNAWGDTFDAALKANNDTFHFTNCSPQHANFNRNRETWQGLENYILNQLAQGRRLVVFNGPIFRTTDPYLDGIQVPMDFWKIVVFRRADGTLAAGGFRVPQDALIRELLDEAFRPSQYQVKIAWIIAETGLKFDHLLPHDRFAQTGGPLEATRPQEKRVLDPADAVL